jgi:hypothetical protein
VKLILSEMMILKKVEFPREIKASWPAFIAFGSHIRSLSASYCSSLTSGTHSPLIQNKVREIPLMAARFAGALDWQYG